MAELSVLLVSGDQRWKLALAEVLSRDGYEVLMARSVQECYDLLHDPQIGTVIADWELTDQGVTIILERVGVVRAHLPVLIAADERVLDDVMGHTGFVAADYLPKQCSELLLRYRVTKALQCYQDIMRAAESRSPGGPDWKRELQETVRELSCLYNIAQAVGRDTGLDIRLQAVTRLLAQGMRFSGSAVVEIWLDGKRYSDFPELSERTCEISAPVMVANRERGKLVAYSCRAHSFSTGETAMVATAARKVGYTVRRNELRRALAASESRHRKLLEAVTQGVFWAHFDGNEEVEVENPANQDSIIERCLDELRLTDCNLTFATCHGFATVGECIGTRLRQLFEDATVAREYMRQLIAHDYVSQIVKKKLSDGGEGSITMVCHTIRHGGKLIGIQGFNCDKPTGRDLWLSEARQTTGPDTVPGETKPRLEDLDLAYDDFPCGILIADLAGRVTYVNRWLVDSFGLRNGTAVGDIAALAIEGQEELELEIRNDTIYHGSWSGEVQRRGPDGDLRTYALATSLMCDESGEPMKQLHVYRDITTQERRLLKLEQDADSLHHAVEQKTRELVQSVETRRRVYHFAPIGIAITSLSGLLQDVNDELTKLFKSHRDGLLERNLGFFCRDEGAYRRLLSDVLSAGKVLDRELEYRAVDGTVLTVEQSSVAKEGPEEEPLIIHFLKDVTEARRMAQESQEQQQQLVRTERLAALGHLVAGVAHELNNPLTAVLTYAHLLRRKTPEGDDRRDKLDTIIEAADRCRQIIRELLDFARENPPAKAYTELNDAVGRVLNMMQNQLLIQKVTVATELAEDLPLVWANPHEMEQVFLNLCANAAEAMEGGGQLLVASEHNVEKGIVAIAFRDTGRGVSQEDLEKIFDPFFTTKEVGKGTGLGLAVSQRIVAGHNGAITVESELGVGSVFTVTFPVSTPEQ